MSKLIPDINTAPPSEVTAAQQIVDTANNVIPNLTGTLNELFASFYNNHEGATPQQIALALGPRAAAVFAVSAATVQYIVGVSQQLGRDHGLLDIVVNPPYNITVNSDGTVTLSPKS